MAPGALGCVFLLLSCWTCCHTPFHIFLRSGLNAVVPMFNVCAVRARRHHASPSPRLLVHGEHFEETHICKYIRQPCYVFFFMTGQIMVIPRQPAAKLAPNHRPTQNVFLSPPCLTRCLAGIRGSLINRRPVRAVCRVLCFVLVLSHPMFGRHSGKSY